MNESENNNVTSNETPVTDTPTPVAIEAAPTTTATEHVNEEVQEIAKNPRSRYFMIAAVVIVVAIFAAIFYSMEKSGRTNTGIFSGIENFAEGRETVAVVNGEKITGKDLAISTEQIAAGAKLQGINVEDPAVQKDIRAQAIEVLVNTELLLQEAASRGIEVTNQDVDDRYNSLIEEVGGAEVLEERMAQFGIDDSTLRRDIKNELTIQQLLDQIFAEENFEISDDEVQEMYDIAGGTEGGLPPIEEIRDQIEAQISATKEQEVIASFVDELRTNAEIEVLVEV